MAEGSGSWEGGEEDGRWDGQGHGEQAGFILMRWEFHVEDKCDLTHVWKGAFSLLSASSPEGGRNERKEALRVIWQEMMGTYSEILMVKVMRIGWN